MDSPVEVRLAQRRLLVIALLVVALALAEGFVFFCVAMWLLALRPLVSVSVGAVAMVVLGSVAAVVLVRCARNRQLRFSLRAMFVVLLVLGWSLGRVSNEFRKEVLRDNVQQAAINKLVKLGDKKTAVRGRERVDRLPYPLVELIVSCVPNDRALFLGQVIEVDLSGTTIRDEQLSVFADLNGLAELDLSGTQVTDSGLVQLHHLTNLKTLSLRGTGVTPNGVNDLRRRLPSLSVEF